MNIVYTFVQKYLDSNRYELKHITHTMLNKKNI